MTYLAKKKQASLGPKDPLCHKVNNALKATLGQKVNKALKVPPMNKVENKWKIF